jgi:hypothetical protein
MARRTSERIYDEYRYIGEIGEEAGAIEANRSH